MFRVIALMTKKLILHIGIHKTGTTAIQQFLSANRELLGAQGIFYPQLKCEWNNHNPLAWHLMDSRYVPPNARYYKRYSASEHWKTLFDAVSNRSYDTVLLSGEDFSLAQDPTRLADLCKNFDTRIIVYLRRQDQLIQSVYNQDVKDHAWMCTQTMGQFFSSHRLNDLIHYDLFLGRWASAFGKENLIIGVYDKFRLQRGLIADFAAKAKITLDGSFDVQDITVNPSLLSFDIDLKRILNGIGLSADENEELLEAMKMVRESNRDLPRSRVHQELSLIERKVFMDTFLEENRKVAKTYLGEDSCLFAGFESDGYEVPNPCGGPCLESDVAPLVMELLRRASIQNTAFVHEERSSKLLTTGSDTLEIMFSKASLTEDSARLYQLPESAQDSENLYSMSNWAPVYLPLLEKIKPKRIVEIGAELGGNTAILKKFCIENEVELHSVDTVIQLESANCSHPLIHRHQTRSVDFLASSKGAEVYFIDADHNYQSVLAELELIERAHDSEAPLLVIMHDTGWPCAFRDSYYDPPKAESYKNTLHVDKGPVPWRSDLVENGFGACFVGWVDRECGAKNGVKTAIEDFVALRKGWKRAYSTPFYGVCFLWYEPSFSAEQKQYMNEMISILKQVEPIFATLEWNRVLLYLKIQKLVAETRYAGELWKKQQDWIQHLEQKLREK